MCTGITISVCISFAHISKIKCANSSFHFFNQLSKVYFVFLTFLRSSRRLTCMTYLSFKETNHVSFRSERDFYDHLTKSVYVYALQGNKEHIARPFWHEFLFVFSWIVLFKWVLHLAIKIMLKNVYKSQLKYEKKLRRGRFPLWFFTLNKKQAQHENTKWMPLTWYSNFGCTWASINVTSVRMVVNRSRDWNRMMTMTMSINISIGIGRTLQSSIWWSRR